MRKIRVLVVDDSVVIRRLLTDILNEDPDIEVAGIAANGRIALSKLEQLNPDIVTLDIEMPDLDGLSTLPLLREKYPKLPVIMFSTLTTRGAVDTLEALSRGASDYVAKPANVGSVAASMQSVKDQLLPKIKALCPDIVPQQTEEPKPLRAKQKPVTPAKRNPGQRYELVVIGSSTGGPQALAKVIGGIPGNFPIPIVIVQHMPPVFTKHLAHRLDQDSQLDIYEAQGGESLRPGMVLIAPGDYHLELKRASTSITTLLHQAPPENSCRPAVDVLFRSAAKISGEACLSVVLTGMGQDGLRGGEEIVHNGGTLIAQDEQSSVVWGMPRAVTEAGITSCQLPLDAIAQKISLMASVGRQKALT